MSVKEGVKDFLVGVVAVALGIILTILLILLWPFIAVVGWLAVMLLLVALAITIAVALIMIIGKLVRSSYKKSK